MVVPALRFPEFRDAEGWEDTTLGDIAEFYKGKGISKSDITINGHLPCIRYGELYTHYNEIINYIVSYTGSQSDNLVLSQINDVIIPSSGETKEDIATASCVMVDNVALGGDLNIIRSHINGIFLSYYLNNAKKYEISQLAQGYSVVHLYAEQLRKLHICTPKSKEQQKIADCLGSLDSLINTVADKIEVLKVYKKGLMQQLFPAEGKTTPDIRFPEFQNDEEWKETTLGDIASKTGDGIHGTPKYIGNSEYFFVNGNNLINGQIVISSNTKCVSKDEYEFHKKDLDNNTILISINGTIGNIAKYNGEKIILGKSAAYLKFDNNCSFFYQILQSPQIKSYFESELSGSTIKNLSLKSIRQTIISIPSKIEQQKIADCLSSVDELISDETAKLDQLKAHKKGLMQQLFPKL